RAEGIEIAPADHHAILGRAEPAADVARDRDARAVVGGATDPDAADDAEDQRDVGQRGRGLRRITMALVIDPDPVAEARDVTFAHDLGAADDLAGKEDGERGAMAELVVLDAGADMIEDREQIG